MTQNDVILNHLKNGPITPAEAWSKYSIMRLSARVNDLRNMGHHIKTEIIEGPTKRRYALYRLMGTQPDAIYSLQDGGVL